MSQAARKRQEILSLVADYYSQAFPAREFVPGETAVRYAGRVFDEEELTNAVDSSLDFWLTSGRYAEKFEKELAEFLKIKYCMLTNSGSSANLLAISALTSPQLGEKRLRPGDEVVTTACGFPTTLNTIIQNNLTPVFIDVELRTYNVDISKIEEAITKKTKAIFVAHTMGNPVNVEKILKVVKKHNLWFVEDNCDALGSKYKGKYTGTFGHISTCSFYPSHHITMGEGGAVLTDDRLLHKIILSLRSWGRDCWCEPGHDNTCGKRFLQQHGRLPFGYDHKYVFSHIGYNLKITDMQAAVGCAQLKKLNGFIQARKKNFDYLYNHLKQYKKYFILPETQRNSEPSWFGLPLLIREDAPFSRADIVQYLEENKIATRMLFGGNLIRQPAYEQLTYRLVGKLVNTDLVMSNLFWIGVYPGLKGEHIRYMAKVFDRFFSEIRLKCSSIGRCKSRGERIEDICCRS